MSIIYNHKTDISFKEWTPRLKLPENSIIRWSIKVKKIYYHMNYIKGFCLIHPELVKRNIKSIK